MFPDSKKYGWDFILSGDFSGLSTKYHANKMRERKDARLFNRYLEKTQRREAFAKLREFDERLEKIKTDAEFDNIIAGNTEKGVPTSGPKHRLDRLTLGQRLYAWWCGHAF